MNTDSLTKSEESFRDKISTIDKAGKRIWVYPKKPKGSLHRARVVVAVVLLAFLFGAPFIKINGHPLILLNVVERKFILFGMVFWPQDFHLFALALISLFVFIILFTAVFGRIWCGWACPQTIFMEMVFRKIEYWIEGDAARQRAVNKAPWTREKIFKKGIKHALFFAIAFMIGNTFLAYIIGMDELYQIVTDPPHEHLLGLSFMLLFSLTFYGVFARFREQVCTMVCPYGRLQGVMLDSNSIVVAYDNVRGEPRGKYRKDGERNSLGDCVDCTLCVQVCPTGIDIRNGTQLECVNCTACIDACNGVMEKLEFPKGLIRFASLNGILNGEKLKVTPRIVLYIVLFTGLIFLLLFLMTNRTQVEATILRTPGVLYQEIDDGILQNLYNVKIINKTFEKFPVSLKLLKPEEGEIYMVTGSELYVEEEALAESAFFVKIPREKVVSQKMPVTIGVYRSGELIEKVNTTFLGPRVGPQLK